MNTYMKIAKGTFDVLQGRRLLFLSALLLLIMGMSWMVGTYAIQGNISGIHIPLQTNAAARRAARAEGRRKRNGMNASRSLFPLGTYFAFRDNGADAQVPAFGKAVFPVDRVPNWGSMRSPAEWDRPYGVMTEADFVPVPPYDLAQLTIPIASLTNPIVDANIPLLTAKLFYSTRYFAAYDLDADEFTGNHAGVDLKLPLGTPVRVIGGGIVREAGDGGALGTYVMVEHRLKNGGKFFSIYGHLRSMAVRGGDEVSAGQVIGEVGSTGESTGPHLHLQVDRGDGLAPHVPFAPLLPLSRDEAAQWSVNPITFIQEHTSTSW